MQADVKLKATYRRQLEAEDSIIKILLCLLQRIRSTAVLFFGFLWNGENYTLATYVKDFLKYDQQN